jgi:hypothetical protein
MKFSIWSLVSTPDPYQPSSFAVGLDIGLDMENKILNSVAFVQLANTFFSNLVSKIYQTMSICAITLETVCKIANIRICPQISVFALIYPYLPPYLTSGICAVVSKIICQSTRKDDT